MPGTPFKSHSKYITTLCFEPFHLQARGRPRLASSSKDATVRICDVVSKRIDMVLSGHKGCVTCVRWVSEHSGSRRFYLARSYRFCEDRII